MSWHDLRNIEESEEDRALRAELRDMLGAGARPPQAQAEAAPDAAAMAALAQSLHREAVRRRRTSAPGGPRVLGSLGHLGRRAAFIALAAAVPIAAALTAMGAWGSRLRQREEALSAATVELASRQSRMDEAVQAAREKEAQPPPEGAKGAEAPTKGGNGGKGSNGELVRPEERPARLGGSDERHIVKDRR
jgi:hypothetical protein